MGAYSPLQRELPALRKNGRIKFRVVLGMARSERRFRRAREAREDRIGPGASCLIRRLDRVRADMKPIRQRIADDRAFWSIDNVPNIPVRQNPEDAGDFNWSRPRPPGEPIAPAPADLRRAA